MLSGIMCVEVCDALFCPCVKLERLFVTFKVGVTPDTVGVKFEGANMESGILWSVQQAARAETALVHECIIT